MQVVNRVEVDIINLKQDNLVVCSVNQEPFLPQEHNYAMNVWKGIIKVNQGNRNVHLARLANMQKEMEIQCVVVVLRENHPPK